MPRDLLRRYPLFALIDPSEANSWFAQAQELTFATGETIFQEGTDVVWSHLVLVAVLRIVPYSLETGREVSLGMVGPGEVFGEYAILSHLYTATCRAAEPTRLLRLPLSGLRVALARHPEFHGNIKRWMRLHVLLNYLRGQAFLGFMTAVSGLKYLDSLQAATFQPMRTIQVDGLASDHWYFIEQGTVALHASKMKSNGPPRILGPGDCFGERSLVGWKGLQRAVALTLRCLYLQREASQPPSGMAQEFSNQSFKPASNRSEPYAWIGQKEEADCGLAALAMVARSHRRQMLTDEFLNCVQDSNQGLKLVGIATFGWKGGARRSGCAR